MLRFDGGVGGPARAVRAVLGRSPPAADRGVGGSGRSARSTAARALGPAGGVGLLDLLAGDPEQVEHGVEVRHVDRGVGRSRTTGLALKAMPSPAAASMSRSLAPSPIATVWAERHALGAANRRSAAGLAGPVHDRADHPPGEHAVDDLEGVGAHVVDPELGGQRLDDLAEAAGHQRDR